MSGFEPGFVLGHYRITRALGSGGMADVYEAHDDNLDRTVALKVLPMEYVRNPQLVQRFQKEVRAAAKLNHRNIVTVFEVGQQDSWHFFSMRLLTGGDLRRRIEAGLTPLESLAILREVADAFAHAHARGFVHRDVKPENIMFDEQGFPVLTDFGIAKALDANTHMTRTGMTMGTPRYLSPEQASGKPVDARADLYSLGIIFHEMLTGRPPYDAEESMAVIFKHVTEPIPVLPPDFGKYQPLLEKLMAKDANQRIASAADLIKEIDALVPRNPTAELKQSQLRTAENPLLAGLLTPSPLRTPAPRTPAPVTPRPEARPPTKPPVTKPMTSPPLSGEVAVRAPPVATRPPAAPAGRAPTIRPAPAPAPVDEAAVEQAVAAPPARRSLLIPIAAVTGLAIAGVTSYFALQPRPPAAPVVAPPQQQQPAVPDAAAQKEKQRQEAAQRDQLRLQQEREANAKRKADADALARKQAEDDAARKAAADAETRRQADAAAKAEAERRAAAQAEAERKAAAEAEARRQAEAARQAEAQRKAAAEAEAQRKAAAEAEAKRQAESAPSTSRAEELERAAREADRQRAAQQGTKPAPTRRERREEDQKKKQEEEKASEENEAEERSRRPMGF